MARLSGKGITVLGRFVWTPGRGREAAPDACRQIGPARAADVCIIEHKAHAKTPPPVSSQNLRGETAQPVSASPRSIFREIDTKAIV